jgi:UDP-N-acetylglucosamine transferase subunit ALG13
VDDWLGTGRAGVRCLMQMGTSTPPTGPAAWRACLEFDALQAVMREAAVVACHGGPGTILAARSMGVIPEAVPRQPRLSEHIIDHQVIFTRRLADVGGVFLAETEAGLHVWQRGLPRTTAAAAGPASGTAPSGAGSGRRPSAVGAPSTSPRRYLEPWDRLYRAVATVAGRG